MMHTSTNCSRVSPSARSRSAGDICCMPFFPAWNTFRTISLAPNVIASPSSVTSLSSLSLSSFGSSVRVNWEPKCRRRWRRSRTRPRGRQTLPSAHDSACRGTTAELHRALLLFVAFAYFLHLGVEVKSNLNFAEASTMILSGFALRRGAHQAGPSRHRSARRLHPDWRQRRPQSARVLKFLRLDFRRSVSCRFTGSRRPSKMQTGSTPISRILAACSRKRSTGGCPGDSYPTGI